MNIRKIIRVGMVASFACMSVMMTGCLDDDTNSGLQDIPVSYVSLYNASPDAPGLNILVDSRQINNEPLRYADNTGYLRFYTGKRTLAFGPYGASNVTLDTVVTLEDNKPYSIFVVDNFEHAEALVLTDTSAVTPGTGKGNDTLCKSFAGCRSACPESKRRRRKPDWRRILQGSNTVYGNRRKNV